MRMHILAIAARVISHSREKTEVFTEELFMARAAHRTMKTREACGRDVPVPRLTDTESRTSRIAAIRATTRTNGRAVPQPLTPNPQPLFSRES